jgi:hypothetical protein
MKLYFYTQVFENYGSPGEPYWKAKGAGDYVSPLPENYTQELIDVKINKFKAWIEEVCGPRWWESFVSATVVEDDYLTDFELQQLEWDGKIDFPVEVLDL